MTIEEFRKAIREDGSTDQRLSIFPDDKHDAIVSMRIAQAVVQVEPEAATEETPSGGNMDSTAD